MKPRPHIIAAKLPSGTISRRSFGAYHSAGRPEARQAANSSNDDRRLHLRIADALASPRFLLFYLGFYAGCMATVGLAILWSQVLS